MREYVEKMLHTRVEHEPVAISGLPLYLRGLYSLERWTVFGVPLALLDAEGNLPGMPQKITDILHACMAADGMPENGPSLSIEVNALLKEMLHRLGYGQESPEEAAAHFLAWLEDIR